MKEKLIPWRAAKNGPLQIELAGITYPHSPYMIQRERSDTFVLEQIVSGKGTLEIGNKIYKPKAGDVYLLQLGTKHKYYSSPKDPWEKMWFNIEGPLAQALADSYGFNGIYLVPDANLQDLFREGLDICEDCPPDAEEGITLVIHSIFIKLAEKIREQNPNIKKISIPLKNYLDRNFDRSPTLQEMSKIIHRSESQTIRIFKDEWGTTPHQYLLLKKLNTAATMLLNSSKAIKEIASELGFENEYYFSSIFKKKMGISPKFYRKTKS